MRGCIGTAQAPHSLDMSDDEAYKSALQLRTGLTAVDLIGFAQKIEEDVFAFETIGVALRRCSVMVSQDPAVRAEITAVGEEGSSHRLVCTSAGLGFQGTLISETGLDILRKCVTTHKLALTDRKAGAADGEYVITLQKLNTQS